MKVYINRKPVVGPWGGGNMWIKSAYEMLPNLGHEIVNIKDLPEVLYLVGLSGDEGFISVDEAIIYKKWASSVGKKVYLVLRVNENDARKGTKDIDEKIRRLSKEVDKIVFVSKWLQDYFSLEGVDHKQDVIHNGVDKSVFKSNNKLSNGKINIVTHHWSDNYLKGFDVYDAIDQWIGNNTDFTFTYIGRERGSFSNTKVIKPMFGKELGDELGKYDVYVSASRFDPGPNHIIESLSCEIPTYVHHQGGGCIEFSGEDHVYKDEKSLLNILSKKVYTKNEHWMPPSWEECMIKFSTIAKEFINEKRS